MKRRLITSALPYVNNVPHLGNLIQVLSADVFARFCRLRGYETLYVCGTDEYGTATETKAQEEGITPRELCDKFNALHTQIYSWFNIAFDKFGRTSTSEQTEIVQGLFKDLDSRGLILEKTIEQLYCESCARFLADRYVRGTCPHCGYEDARGDQCEHCGKLLDPTDLKSPRCHSCGTEPKPRTTKHLFIDLPAIKDKLEAWMKEASVRGFWARNAIQMTQAWIRDGLHERCITRDLKWGIPVPKPGYEDKVFYVWFDAPIGYISISATHTKDWKSWWQAPDDVELFQFIGKDNIPFHTVIFPCTLLGSGRNWTMLHHMSSTEYLNYEGTKFSKSKGIGVFGTDAMETGIPADAWRFYVYYSRPEVSDAFFYWKDFQEKINGELNGNLGNLANRTLTFVTRYFGGKVPAAPEWGSAEAAESEAFWAQVREKEEGIAARLERAELREAFREAFSLSSLANKAFQDGEPWKTRTAAPEKAARLIRDLCHVLRDLAVIMHPYIPGSAEKLASFFGKAIGKGGLDWSSIGKAEGVEEVLRSEILFAQLEDDKVEVWKEKYSGSQKERAERDAGSQKERAERDAGSQKERAERDAGSQKEKAERDAGSQKEKAERDAASGAAKSADKPAASAAPKPAQPGAEAPKEYPLAALPLPERFAKRVELRVAEIKSVERHPKADKLYVEAVDLGGETRTIVSGLVPHYKEEELLGKRVVVVANLKAAKLRGTMSQGMLLAASMPDPDAPPPAEGAKPEAGAPPTEIVEVLDAAWAAPGSRVAPEGIAVEEKLPEIDIDEFFSMPIAVEEGVVKVGGVPLLCEGRPFSPAKVKKGEVG